MGIKPIDMMMTITQSQNIKSQESDQNIKHAIQAQQLADQNTRSKEAVSRIPDDDNHTEVMDTIKQGMTDNNGEFNSSSHHKHSEEEEIPDKALLDEDNGHSLDIMG